MFFGTERSNGPFKERPTIYKSAFGGGGKSARAVGHLCSTADCKIVIKYKKDIFKITNAFTKVKEPEEKLFF